MFDSSTIAVVIGTFFLAGTVKGTIGLGLPSVTMAVLTLIIDIPTAMAFLLVPSFATNLWQATVGGHGRAIVRRIWPFLFMATLTVWLGAQALTRINLSYLSVLLGLLLIVYGTVSLAGPRLTLSRRREIWAGPIAGMFNGLLAGMTGSFAVPGVMFFQAIGLPRDKMVQAMGILFTASTLALAIALRDSGLLSLAQGQMSAVALLPALLGMALGQRIRRRLSEQLFRRIFFA
ncbi:MAG: sulfite exporter TauE/SafE family protein, partial [Rhodospirillaceae bacterium]|nr:sulfite exporter TauE/SafE family protein [Rhodospirillaceae bacterium]